jgi:hypothetical protein
MPTDTQLFVGQMPCVLRMMHADNPASSASCPDWQSPQGWCLYRQVSSVNQTLC